MGDPQGAPLTQSGMKITWSEDAINDLRSLRTQISAENPAAAKGVALHILHCVEQLLPVSVPGPTVQLLRGANSVRS
jgi:plasmid stabilization system protein ParE